MTLSSIGSYFPAVTGFLAKTQSTQGVAIRSRKSVRLYSRVSRSSDRGNVPVGGLSRHALSASKTRITNFSGTSFVPVNMAFRFFAKILVLCKVPSPSTGLALSLKIGRIFSLAPSRLGERSYLSLLRILVWPVDVIVLLASSGAVYANDADNHTVGFYHDQEPLLVAGLPFPRLPSISLPRPSAPVVLVPPAPGFYLRPWFPFRHFGFKTGNMFVNIDGGGTRPTSGFMASSRFHAGHIAVAAFEMEAMTTHSGSIHPNSGAGKWDASMVGFYGSFRFGDSIYGKIKTGWRWRIIETSEEYAEYRGHSYTTMYFPGANTLDWRTVPYALALGWRVGPHDVMEMEFNYLDKDLAMVSFAYIF